MIQFIHFTLISVLKRTKALDGLNDINADGDRWEKTIKAALDMQYRQQNYQSEDIEKIKRKYFEGVDLKDDNKLTAKWIEVTCISFQDLQSELNNH